LANVTNQPGPPPCASLRRAMVVLKLPQTPAPQVILRSFIPLTGA
jgi:hypothetical protein